MAIGVNWGEVWKPVWKAVWQTVYVPPPAPAPQRGAGSAKKRRKYTVEIDGEQFQVSSQADAEQLLEEVRRVAKEKADEAFDKAAKAEKRPVRKVMQDARKALPVPKITAPPDFQAMAEAVLAQVQDTYRNTLRDIEIAALLRRRQQEEEDDDEVLLLL